MVFIEKLKKTIEKNKSQVCIGLDPDLSKFPTHLKSNPEAIYEFNKSIIEGTVDVVCAYKPNIAFYEAEGWAGLQALKKTIEFIAGRVPVILDAKRGDIGNTAQAYAKSIFEDFKADAVTLSPYMGLDSLEPFLKYKDKGAFILCLTSNPGADDFQKPDLYKQVASKVFQWNVKYKNMGLVVGATNGKQIQEIRKIAPGIPFLVPGVGAQGGDLEEVFRKGVFTKEDIVIINSSRKIIYASAGKDYAQAAKQATHQLNTEINKIRSSL
ncbi:MAG: orotidine-5'-phosphate decarboxylase [Candidatus Margulisbacteria bacterium]|nr:orotidine-5'-phosphate decarboxylase [Candidatus Margulisiibacteriota bacterium]